MDNDGTQIAAVTDSSAIRDNPNATPDQNGNTSIVVYERESYDATGLFGDGGKKKKWGTGVFLSRYRRPHEGTMGASLGLFALDRIEPNPVTEKAMIHWHLASEADVSLRIYNAAGQLVRVLVDGQTRPGQYVTVWDGADARGRRVAEGVYFYTLDAAEKRMSRKLILTR